MRPDSSRRATRPLTETPARRGSRLDFDQVLRCVAHVTTPTGKKPVLKAMVTTACEKNCFYCPFRAGRSSTHRLTFSPDELARVYTQVQRAGIVDGIFLSSGIINGGATVQDKIIDTIEILRRKHDYRGYVHLKIMPGAEFDQLRRAMQLADRVSINLEGPTPARLHALAPKKDFTDELFQRLRWAHQIRQRERVRASVVTQFVVGAVGDTDLELLSLSDRLYNQLGLKRAYYSGFSPIADTPFEDLPPTDPLRERRLYQASFLLRDYAWDVEDLPFEGVGNLRLDVDPKRAWAEAHLRHAPVDVMRADRTTLLRIPGIGPRGADAILKARRRGRLSDLAHLRAVGVVGVARAAPYILLDGRRPPEQLPLFAQE
ncbi:MAG: radical SAM protein [Anaerolineae bacterium]|nr:radical SAM protein [Anaerolineae bacterium]